MWDFTSKWGRNDREKATAFATHVDTVLQPFPSSDTENDKNILQFLDTYFQITLSVPHITPIEVQDIVKNSINNKKAPGFDLISAKDLNESTKN